LDFCMPPEASIHLSLLLVAAPKTLKSVLQFDCVDTEFPRVTDYWKGILQSISLIALTSLFMGSTHNNVSRSTCWKSAMNIQSVEKFIFTKLLEIGGAFAKDTKSFSAWDKPVYCHRQLEIMCNETYMVVLPSCSQR
jgi:hypothetical protein